MKKIIEYKGKKFIGVEIKKDYTKDVLKVYTRHGCPECHFCDMSRTGLGFVCNDSDVADTIKEIYKGCNGFDMKNNIIFLEISDE